MYYLISTQESAFANRTVVGVSTPGNYYDVYDAMANNPMWGDPLEITEDELEEVMKSGGYQTKAAAMSDMDMKNYVANELAGPFFSVKFKAYNENGLRELYQRLKTA